jgi:hypothetical protein
MFKVFQQHLNGHPCWPALEEVEICLQEYGEAGRHFYNGVLNKVLNRFKENGPDVSKSYLDIIAASLMVDACSGGRLNFLYKLQRVQGKSPEREARGQASWCLELDVDRSVGPEADAEQLTPIVELHQALRKEVATSQAMEILKQAAADARARVAEFQEYLSPDEQLWKLLLQGRCNSCL